MQEQNKTRSNEEFIKYDAHPKTFKSHPILTALSLFFTLPGIVCLITSPDTTAAIILTPGVLIISTLWLRSKSSKLTITTEKTTLRTGILSKNENQVEHRDVRNIKISQSLFQRIFRIGKIEISSAAQSDIEIKINGITDPQKARDTINQHRKDTH